MAEIAVGTRMALFARRDWGFDVDRANQFMALFFTGLFLGRLVFAVVHFKWSARRILVVSASLGAMAIALGIFYGPAWMATSGLFLSVFYPCAMSMINDEQGEHASYVIASAITVQSIGLMGMHFVLGGLSDAFGLGKALWIGPVALAGAVLALLVKNPRDWRFS
jgi:fucose permease